MIFLETPRLVLRSLDPKDADVMYDYRNDQRCARFQRGQVRDRAGIAALLLRRQDDVLSLDAPFMLAVAWRDTDELVGEITVKPEGGTIVLGYTISWRHHRQGCAREALTALLDCLHQGWPERDFLCLTEPENQASIALLGKLGFEDLGYMPSIRSHAFGKWTRPQTREKLARAAGAKC